MHDQNVLQQFIQLRVLGFSVPKIAKKIGVPVSTLYDWNERERLRIHKLRFRRIEEAEESVLGIEPVQFERLALYLKVLDKQLAAKIADGDAANLTLPELIRASGSLRRQLDTVKSRGDTLAPNPAESTAEADWPLKPDPNWFAPKQKP
jgi:hypothetical protein